jgi:hypothetical protein
VISRSVQGTSRGVAQRAEVADPAEHPEIAGIVADRLDPERPAFLEVLLAGCSILFLFLRLREIV